jgi:hypothetical protein
MHIMGLAELAQRAPAADAFLAAVQPFDAGLFAHYPAIMNAAMERFHARVDANLKIIGREKADSWVCDEEAGSIAFSLRGKFVAQANYQVIGSLSYADWSWAWAWNDMSVPQHLRAHAENMRAYGEGHGVGNLMKPRLTATDDDAWHFAALGNYLNKAQGVFRAAASEDVRFLTLDHFAGV